MHKVFTKGWIKYTMLHCHKFVDIPTAFAAAISYCKTLGAHLVIVNNQEENEHIEKKLRVIAGEISNVSNYFLCLIECSSYDITSKL